MGIQQVFNFLLYRIDQILLAVVGLKDQIDENVSLYIYLAKFPEILASVIVIIGTVAFPRVYVQYPFTVRSLSLRIKKYSFSVLGYIAAFIGLLYAYIKVWSGQADPLSLAPPFLLNALLIIVANNISYSMLRQGYLNKLIVNMIAAVVIGVSLSILLRVGGNTYALSWIVPIQMASFIILSLTTTWGERIELYA